MSMRGKVLVVLPAVLVAGCSTVAAVVPESDPGQGSTIGSTSTAVVVIAPSTSVADAVSSTTTAGLPSQSTSAVEREEPPDTNDLLETTMPVERLGFFGDSIVADLTNVGGRNNQIVPAIEEHLVSDATLGVTSVANLALPGQSLLFDIGILETGSALLSDYVDQFLARHPNSIDLAVISVSTIDVNLNAAAEGEQLDAVALGDAIVAELEAVVASFAEQNVSVVMLPMLGINEALFNELRCAIKTACPEQAPDEVITVINDRMWNSDLPLLFDAFSGFDADGVAGTDRSWFEGVDPVRPDDGIHPNLDGQAVFVDHTVTALRELLAPS